METSFFTFHNSNPFIRFFNSHESKLSHFIDIKHPSLYIFLFSAAFNPLFWNIVARREYRTKFLSSFIGDKYVACYILATTIFILGIIRDLIFSIALEHQPKWPSNEYDVTLKHLSFFLGGMGSTFVFTSFLSLGFTGTFLGDYFGILMEKKVSGFPFNVLNNPMYDGSTMIFLATSIYHQSYAGVALTLYVWIIYKIALLFEEPFTARIYAKKDKKRD